MCSKILWLYCTVHIQKYYDCIVQYTFKNTLILLYSSVFKITMTVMYSRMFKNTIIVLYSKHSKILRNALYSKHSKILWLYCTAHQARAQDLMSSQCKTIKRAGGCGQSFEIFTSAVSASFLEDEQQYFLRLLETLHLITRWTHTPTPVHCDRERRMSGNYY